MAASEVIEKVVALIEGFVDKFPQPVRGELESLAHRMRQPMRVAVVGRVKAGKSTIVNALLRQRVAPTDVSECTRLVTWFHWGHPQRVILELRDGSEIETQLTSSGMLPDKLPVATDEVRAIHAYLANEALKDVILIDTPGIGSVHEEYSAATQELLDMTVSTTAATTQADAVVFIMNHVVMEDEHEALRRLASASEGRGSAVNTVGVLTKADKLGDAEADPWDVAQALAASFSNRFESEVSTVVPVIGLIAETCEAALLTEMDWKHVSTLAAMEPDDLEPLLWSADRFATREAPVSEKARERLLMMLDLYGIEKAIALIRDGSANSATSLRDCLADLSGISEVSKTIKSLFNSQDDVLKARSALDLLNRLSYRRDAGLDPGLLGQLRSQVEALRMDPVMHPVVEIEAWHDVCTGKLTLPSPFDMEFQHLVSPGSLARRLGVAGNDPQAIQEAAKSAMVRWRAFMVADADPAQAAVARVALRSLQIAYQAASTQSAVSA